jgi:hypothetical protein
MARSNNINQFLIIWLVAFISSSNSISLDESGNYRITVAIDESTLQNSNPDYIQIIQVSENKGLSLSRLYLSVI